ncbi:uncharacterized protein LOC132199389 [Neocloeon triangulifer]|uniref:uncharacterized protein LOC132199389 n=1 Tax=Neocloeon triangulifer TaxID=2078957 RepID=UPI00286F0C4B|nr:uncharacterized protein LOC132199389 [Neocloeon triangulifer]
MWKASMELADHDEVLLDIAITVSEAALKQSPQHPMTWFENLSDSDYSDFVKKSRSKWVSIQHQKSVSSESRERNMKKWHDRQREIMDKMIRSAITQRHQSLSESDVEGFVRKTFFDHRYPAETDVAKEKRARIKQTAVLFLPKNNKKAAENPKISYTDLVGEGDEKVVKEPGELDRKLMAKYGLEEEAENAGETRARNCINSALIHMAMSTVKDSDTVGVFKELTGQVKDQNLSKMFLHLKRCGGIPTEESELYRILNVLQKEQEIKQKAKDESNKIHQIWVRDNFGFQCVRAILGRCTECAETRIMPFNLNLNNEDWINVQSEETVLREAHCSKCNRESSHQLLYILSHHFVLIDQSKSRTTPVPKTFEEALDSFENEVQIGGRTFEFCSATVGFKSKKPHPRSHCVLVTRKDSSYEITCDCTHPEKFSVALDDYRVGIEDMRVFVQLVLYRRKRVQKGKKK